MPLPARVSSFVDHVRARAAWLAIPAVLGLVARCSAPSPPARTVEGVAAMLGAAVAGDVRAEDFVWEERGGSLSDALLGRRVLFLARTHGGARDLYRASVRLTRAGRPVAIRGVHNLTESPLGDDGDLVARGRNVAFTTSAFGVVQGITLLDLAGAREAPMTFGSRVRWALSNFLATGSLQGIARTEVVFVSPPPEAKIELEGDLLVMALGAASAPAAIDSKTLALELGEKDPYGAHAHSIPSNASSASALAITGVARAFGDGAARRIEAMLVGAADMFAKHGSPLPNVSGTRVVGDASFPPSQGTWFAPDVAWLPEPGKDAPPCFAQASIDAETPAGKRSIRLVAFDTRRLDLHLEAGTEAPRSLTGLHGLGRIVRDADRAVAVFATGPASATRAVDTAPDLGVVVDRTELVPPLRGAPTLAIGIDGGARIGAWASAPEAPLPAWLTSLRQTPAELEPRAVDRSALCLLASGQLVYAFARDINPTSLSRALGSFGCTVTLALASAPADVGFSFVHRRKEAAIDSPEGWDATPVVEAMPLDAAHLAHGLRGDFAVLRARDARPMASISNGTWEVDAGTQPDPSFLPGVFAATVTELGSQVHLTAFVPGRFAFHVRAGNKELSDRLGGTFAAAVGDDEWPRVVAALGLGNGRRKTARGLATDGAIGLHFRNDAGVLEANGGRVRIVKSDAYSPPAHADATELPLTADESKLRPEAREVGTMRPRAAACTLEDGTLIAAETTFDTDEATTQALLDLGCTRVVALDRGSHHNAFVQRAGTDAQPERRYDASALFVIQVPMRGRAQPL